MMYLLVNNLMLLVWVIAALSGLTLCEGGGALTTPFDIFSGNDGPSEWSLTLSVEENRHQNDQIAFNTRSYCYNGACSYPGPTIHIKAGDRLKLTILNNLAPNKEGSTHVMNTMHSPNSTNFHTHGLHIDPNVDNVFLQADPGETLHYDFRIPDNHASGLMWYHDHIHGSST
jgi:FtsP/CotA-like multicopper oxidase with cupredoxin domain